MVYKLPITICLTKDTISKVDEFLRRVGMGATRSAFAEEAIIRYLEEKEAQ